MFRRHFAPRLKRIFSHAADRGLDVFFHSCGDVSTILGDIQEAGARVFNPFQPEVMNVPEVARQYAGRLAFYGGISTQHTLPHGGPGDVRREVDNLAGLFREQGGLILAPAHAIQRDVPIDNVLALLNAAKAT
jgi:uroporphyrinogen decarboxylase